MQHQDLAAWALGNIAADGVRVAMLPAQDAL
jgi:hypothetical protein